MTGLKEEQLGLDVQAVGFGGVLFRISEVLRGEVFAQERCVK